MTTTRTVRVESGDAALPGLLDVPDGATGIVVFAHGSGSSRLSPRNRQVADALNHAGLATLLFDLLTADENLIDQRTAELRFDIALLTRRMTNAVDWVVGQRGLTGLAIGLFGASTGAAAALGAAAARPQAVHAVVSRGGRPDLTTAPLAEVRAPVLLIVGGLDEPVIGMNREAAAGLTDVNLQVVPGATHLFEEPGKLEAVIELATAWFTRHLGSRSERRP